MKLQKKNKNLLREKLKLNASVFEKSQNIRNLKYTLLLLLYRLHIIHLMTANKGNICFVSRESRFSWEEVERNIEIREKQNRWFPRILSHSLLLLHEALYEVELRSDFRKGLHQTETVLQCINPSSNFSLNSKSVFPRGHVNNFFFRTPSWIKFSPAYPGQNIARCRDCFAVNTQLQQLATLHFQALGDNYIVWA